MRPQVLDWFEIFDCLQLQIWKSKGGRSCIQTKTGGIENYFSPCHNTLCYLPTSHTVTQELIVYGINHTFEKIVFSSYGERSLLIFVVRKAVSISWNLMIQGVTRQQIPINGWISRCSGSSQMSSFFSFFFLSFWALKDVGYTKANPNIATKTNNRCLFLMIAKFKCLIYSRFD